MTCLSIIDYSPIFALLPRSLEPAHTWATSMLMDVTRQPQPRLRSELLKRHVQGLRLTSKRQSNGYDAKCWLRSVPAQLEREE